jgi:hypothetical protein
MDIFYFLIIPPYVILLVALGFYEYAKKHLVYDIGGQYELYP